jgi:hypothetical protein
MCESYDRLNALKWFDHIDDGTLIIRNIVRFLYEVLGIPTVTNVSPFVKSDVLSIFLRNP